MKSPLGALPVMGRPLCGPLVMKSLMRGTPLRPGSAVGDEVPGVGTSLCPLFGLIDEVPREGTS